MIKRTIEIAMILILLVVGGYTGRNKLTIFYYNKGVSCYDRGAYNDAVDYFKKSLGINPRIVLVHYALANAYREAKTEDKAMEEYERVIRLDGRHLNAYLSMARIYSGRRNYEQALAKLKEADSAVPFNEEIKKLKEEISFAYAADLLNSGTDAFLRKDKKTAYDLLNKSILIKNDLAFSYYILGYFYYEEGRVKEAKTELEKSVRIDSGFWFPHKLLGDIYFSEGDYIRAIDKYKNALKLNTDDSSLYNDLGLALMQRENYAEAVTYLKEAIKLEPGNFDIRYNLASVYRDNNQPEEALAEYNILIKS